MWHAATAARTLFTSTTKEVARSRSFFAACHANVFRTTIPTSNVFRPATTTKVGRGTTRHLSFCSRNYRGYHHHHHHQYYGSGGRLHSFSPNLVVNLIIGCNVGVFAAWNLVDSPAEMRFMVENFTTSLYNSVHGRHWTVLTAAFSHSQMWHFLINMSVLHSVSVPLVMVLGVPRYLTIYMGGAIASSLSHIAYSAVSGSHSFSQGASGAINALLVTLAAVFPKSSILFGLIPTPLAVVGFIGYDMFALGDGSEVDRAGHLGGSAFGILYYLLKLR